MNRRLTIVAYDRPHYLRRVIDKLKQCDALDRFEITASVDGLPGGGHNEEVVAMLHEATDDVRLRERLDCNGHKHAVIQESYAEGVDWLLYLEDDALLARDALCWCLSMEGRMDARRDYDLSLFGREFGREEDARRHLRDTSDEINHVSWACYLSRYGLARMLDLWRPHWNVETGKGGDTWLTETGTWRMVSPHVSRAKNIGRRGRYCDTDEQYALVERRFWSEDL